MQQLGQDGSGNIAVQITGDENTVTVACGGLVLHLQAKHAYQRPVRSDLDLLRPETRLLDLLGRDEELAALGAWLDDPAPVRVRGVVGRAGSGKTRLAIELGEVASARGWRAGFLDSGDLAAFVEAQRTARWPRTEPLLVVVDYAARRARALNAWLQSLARRAEPAKPRLRLLLLERHASSSEGWWAELVRLEGNDDRLYDLLDPFEPVPLPPLAALEQRRALLAGVMAAWCERNGKPVLAPPAAGADPLFDRRLADPALAPEKPWTGTPRRWLPTARRSSGCASRSSRCRRPSCSGCCRWCSCISNAARRSVSSRTGCFWSRSCRCSWR